MSPLISIIIPAYNASAYIRQTLESVLSQTYGNFEVFVVDDGSIDTTADIVREFAQHDRRIVLLQQNNAGVAAARNSAIAQSRGEFIAPLDADDVWYPQKLEKQVNCFLRSDQTVGLVYAWSALIDEAGTRVQNCQTALTEGDVLVPLIFGNFVGNASSPLIRRSCFEVIGDYDCHYRAIEAQGCEDWDLYLRIAERYQFRVVPEVLVGYRQVLGSMSFNPIPMKKACDIMMATLATRHPEIPAALYRWTMAHINLYLAMKCWSVGNHARTLRYLYDSVRLDPLEFLQPIIYPVAGASLLSLFFKPIAVLFWRDHFAWRQFYKQYLKRDRKLAGVLEESALEPVSRSYFDQVIDQRLIRIQHLRKQALNSKMQRPVTSL